jgi:hypothetical protein
MTYFKNIAGDLIKIYTTNEEFQDLECYEWNIKKKLCSFLNIDELDMWRIQFIDKESKYEIDEDKEDKEDKEKTINYFILDDISMYIRIEYIKKMLDIRNNCYYEKYLISIDIDEENYDYYVYYNSYDKIFISYEDIYDITDSIFEINDYNPYNDLKSLLINTKFFPIMYRQKISQLVYDKWMYLDVS